MTVVSNEALEAILNAAKDHPKLYTPQLKMVARMQYLTGARANDVLQFNRWVLLADLTVQLQPQKGNNLRIFTEAEIDPIFYDYIVSGVNPFAGLHYRKYEYYLSQILNKNWFTIGDKKAGSHLFRHNYARKLKDSGMSDAMVMAKLGEVSTTMANFYIYRSIYSGGLS